MNNILFSEEELVVLSYYAEKTKEGAIVSLQDTVDQLKEENPPDEEMIRVLEELLESIRKLKEEEYWELMLLVSPNWDEEDIIE